MAEVPENLKALAEAEAMAFAPGLRERVYEAIVRVATADHLSRQDPNIRRAALEEAEGRTRAAEAFRAWFFQHTGKRIFHTNASKAVDVVVRALSDKGGEHG